MCKPKAPKSSTLREVATGQPWLIQAVYSNKHNYWLQGSCGQGNIFTPVCHSVHRGKGVSEADTPPGSDTPPQVRPPGQTPPRSDTPRVRHAPWVRHGPPGQMPPGTKYTPQTKYTPLKQTLAYSQQAASTHPIGMHSC